MLSLIVALYTIKLATSPSSAQNSYGWQRAEILGALINGVFLIALCVSIFLEAVGRIIAPPGMSSWRAHHHHHQIIMGARQLFFGFNGS